MSKVRLAARGLAAVQVSAEWSVELSGFRDTEYGTRNTEYGTRNTDYYINIMYTIDTIQWRNMQPDGRIKTARPKNAVQFAN